MQMMPLQGLLHNTGTRANEQPQVRQEEYTMPQDESSLSAVQDSMIENPSAQDSQLYNCDLSKLHDISMESSNANKLRKLQKLQ